MNLVPVSDQKFLTLMRGRPEQELLIGGTAAQPASAAAHIEVGSRHG